ncbi:uncharacterized protein LOC135205118 [Macrobrachium nipponense]|uniref:uncharacterized protein LOC135205118 n=1 Tax=Macrobrachium nipponense TaxID=159736 RepID=UPI0030C8CC24
MNGEVRQELRKLYNRWYKGDPLVLTTHSTQVSNTKTYARSGRTSIHSIYSQAERRDRSTPSPQMPRSGYPDGGTPSRTRTASPSPTATLTPSYGSGSRQQSKETNVGQGSSENCEETIELQPRLSSPKKNAANGHNSSNATMLSQLGTGEESNFESMDEGTTVEILIDLTDETSSCKKGISNDGPLEDADPEKRIPYSPVSQNGQVHGKSREKPEKHLTFSESTENRLNYKAARDAEEKRCLLADTSDVEGEDAKGVVCVNVSKKSLKSTSPLLVESTLVKKSTKREQETML